MQSPDKKEWREFSLDDLFTVSAGKRLETRNKISGSRPFVGATDNGNGVTGFVGNENSSKDCNVLGVNYNGAPCIAFYHPYECIFTDDVKRLHLRQYRDGKDILLAFVPAFMQQRSKYSYGYKFNEQRMLRQKLMLPVTDNGEPDYDYMAEGTRQRRAAMLKKYRTYAEKRIAKIGEPVDIPGLNEKEWNHFLIPVIFEHVQRGRRLKNADHIPGKVPYVSSTASNNGVDDYIEATEGTRVFGDCISLANSGSVGTAFYEPFDFVASDHITSLKRIGASQFIYLFLITTIEQQGVNFNFNREINDVRINKMQMMLPVTDTGEPDYAYMEQYAKNIMVRKYRQYLSFLDRLPKNAQ